MGGKRIRYLLRAFDQPFGGVLQIRRQVKLLAEMGFDAAIVTDKDDDARFYDVGVPRIFDRDFTATREDICVVPEGWRQHAMEIAKTPAELICLCQNHYYLNRMFVPGESFKTFGISTVLCCSRQTANYVERYYDAEAVHVIACAVDQQVEPDPEKLRAITFMPRKSLQDAQVIYDVFRRKYPEVADLSWVAIKNLSHAEAMKVLARHAIFLSMSHREGLGLPPLEAMSHGTLVVGFHGGGGLDYATPRNGLWCDEGDLVGCADALHHAVQLIGKGKQEAVDLIEQGRRTAALYSPERLRRKLETFWSDRI